jgi:hypothetical protein
VTVVTVLLFCWDKETHSSITCTFTTFTHKPLKQHAKFKIFFAFLNF